MEDVVVNPDALEVSKLASSLMDQFWVHAAAMYVARDPRAMKLAPEIEPGQIVPIIRIARPNGGFMSAHFNHYLERNRLLEIATNFDKVWLRGAILTLGDAVGDHGFFNHDPEVELIRHLRNGIAHGNTFKIASHLIDKHTEKLIYPANNLRYTKSLFMMPYEITKLNNGDKVLWKWGGPDAFMDCITTIVVHLSNVAYGRPAPCDASQA